MGNKIFPTDFTPLASVELTTTLLGDDGAANGTLTVADILALAGGSAAAILNFEYDVTVTKADPTGGKFRLNNATIVTATELYISNVDKNGIEIATLFSRLKANDKIFLQGIDNFNEGLLINVTSVTDESGYYTVVFTVDDGGTATTWTDATDFGMQMFLFSSELTEDVVVNVDNTMTTAEIQAEIDALPKNLNGHTVTFNFAAGTYTFALNDRYDFIDFYGGTINIDGPGGGGLRTTQTAIIDATASTQNAFYFARNRAHITVSDFRVDVTAGSAGVFVYDCDWVLVTGCYFKGTGVGAYAGVYGYQAGGFLKVTFTNFHAPMTYGIIAYDSYINAEYNGNESGTAPTYGLAALQGGSVYKINFQPSGTTADTYVESGGYFVDSAAYESKTDDAILTKSEINGRLLEVSAQISSGVDLTSVAQTDMYTVPTGKLFVIDELEVVVTEITGAGAVATIRFGTDGAEAEILAAVALDAAMLVQYGREYWTKGALLKTVLAAGEILEFGVTVAGTSTTHVATIIARGLLIDA
jgi:hypothetical protein